MGREQWEDRPHPAAREFLAEESEQGSPEERIGRILHLPQQRLGVWSHPAKLGSPAPQGRVLGGASRKILAIHDALDDGSLVMLVRHDEVRQERMQAAALKAAAARDKQRDVDARFQKDMALPMVVAAKRSTAGRADAL